jgi:hypothetical protein
MQRRVQTRARETRRLLPIASVLARAAVLAVAGAVTACGGGGVDDAGDEVVVNAVEAELAIDDVRVAGVALGSGRGVAPVARPGETAAAAAEGTAAAAEEMGTAGAAGRMAPARGAGSAARRLAEEARREAALQPLARLEVGEPLVVDLEVADAPAGSEVTVVWGTAEGRAVWRQTRAVGDEPRLSFSADTAGWPAAVYQGAILYGLQTVHRFAVRVGAVPPPTRVAAATTGASPGAAGTGGEAVASAAPGATAGDGARVAPTAGGVPTAGAAASSPAATSPSPAPAAPAPRGAQPAPAAAPSSTPAATEPEPAAPQPAPEAEDPIEIVPQGPPPEPPPADEPVPEGDEDEPPRG